MDDEPLAYERRAALDKRLTGCLAPIAIGAYLLYLPVAFLALTFGGTLGGSMGWATGAFWFAAPGLVILLAMVLVGVRRSTIGIVAVGLLVFCIPLGVSRARANPPVPSRLASTLDEAGVPDGWEMATEERYDGSCFDICPAVHRTYRVAEGTNPREAVEQLLRRIEDAGLAPEDVIEYEDMEHVRFTGHVFGSADGDHRVVVVDAGYPQYPAPGSDHVEIDVRIEGREVP